MDKPCVILIYARPGHGKTTLLKRLSASLDFQHLFVITAAMRDDYNASEIAKFGLPPDRTFVTPNFEYAQLEAFRELPGKKLLIMDDVLHLNTTSGVVANQIRDLFSRQRHYEMYIIASVQLLKALGKPLRFCCTVFFTGHIDEEAAEVARALMGMPKNIFMMQRLKKFQFLMIQAGDDSMNLVDLSDNN